MVYTVTDPYCLHPGTCRGIRIRVRPSAGYEIGERYLVWIGYLRYAWHCGRLDDDGPEPKRSGYRFSDCWRSDGSERCLYLESKQLCSVPITAMARFQIF